MFLDISKINTNKINELTEFADCLVNQSINRMITGKDFMSFKQYKKITFTAAVFFINRHFSPRFGNYEYEKVIAKLFTTTAFRKYCTSIGGYQASLPSMFLRFLNVIHSESSGGPLQPHW